VLREPRLRVLALVPELLAVDGDDEVALASRDLLDVRLGVGGFDGGGQTGRRG